MFKPAGTKTIVFLIVLVLLCPWPQGQALSDEIEELGNVLRVAIPAAAYGTTYLLKDEKGRRQFYESFFTNLLVSEALKQSIHKKRPNGKEGSFPSGHTLMAFQGAAFIHRRYGLKYAILSYLGASFVGYSRIESDNHYLEDVLAGALLGIVSSYLFVKPYKGLEVSLHLDEGLCAINFRFNF